MDEPAAIYDTVSPCGRAVRVDATRGLEISAIGQPCYPWMGSYACAVVLANGQCRVYAVRNKLTPERLDHELRHCDGWPADHPDSWRRMCRSR